MSIASSGNRLRSVDALRGAAAIGVVLYHIVGPTPGVEAVGLARLFALSSLTILSLGYVGVFLFFVISGFCIHLQWARAAAAGKSQEIDFIRFWKRRLRRLYPPYLIALALYLTVAFLTSDVRFTPFYWWDTCLHLLMLHNLDARTAYSISGVFWTLAIEEQLYLAYFLLLFLRKRRGWAHTLLICGAARAIWFVMRQYLHRKFHFEIPVTEAAASHWLTWALGAVSVEAAVGLIRLPGWCRDFRLGLLTLLSAAGITYALRHTEGALHDGAWLLLHPVWGVGFFIVLNYAVACESRWRMRMRAPRLIRGLAAVGVFSYSLYLTHQLVIMESYKFNFLGLPERLTGLIVMTPLSLACAWLFFRFCERPFMPRHALTAPPPAVNDSIAGSATGSEGQFNWRRTRYHEQQILGEEVGRP